MSCKREQLSLLKLPRAADIMESTIAALTNIRHFLDNKY